MRLGHAIELTRKGEKLEKRLLKGKAKEGEDVFASHCANQKPLRGERAKEHAQLWERAREKVQG